MSVPTLLSRFALLVALSASCRVRSSRSPRRRLSASLLHHVPPTRQRHGPRDNVLPPATLPRHDHVLPPATTPRHDHVTPPATQLPRRSPDNVAGAPEPSSRRPHTPAPSPAHPATQHRTRPPPTRQRRHTRPTQQPPHEAPPQRHPQRRSTSRRHTGARAEHQGATQLPRCAPTQPQRGAEQSTIAPPPHRNGITASRHITATATRHTSGQHIYGNRPTNSTSDRLDTRPDGYRGDGGA